MSYQLWSWLLGFIGLIGFYFSGQKKWWSWYINLFNQSLWLVYSLISGQYGFLIATAGYTIVFTKNAIFWTREHFANKRLDPHVPIGRVTAVEADEKGLKVNFVLNDDFSPTARKVVDNLTGLSWALSAIRDEDKDSSERWHHLQLGCTDVLEFDGRVLTCEHPDHTEQIDHMHLLRDVVDTTKVIVWDSRGLKFIKEL